MKEIYAISLDEDVPLSDEIDSDIREIATFTYDALDRYDRHGLCLKDDRNLYKNDLLEIYPSNGDKFKYVFVSERTPSYCWDYEPFMINNISFGFTTYEGTITKEEVERALHDAMRFLHKEYNFKITTIKYTDDKTGNRYKAISSINTKKEGKIRKKMRPILTMLSL